MKFAEFAWRLGLEEKTPSSPIWTGKWGAIQFHDNRYHLYNMLAIPFMYSINKERAANHMLQPRTISTSESQIYNHSQSVPIDMIPINFNGHQLFPWMIQFLHLQSPSAVSSLSRDDQLIEVDIFHHSIHQYYPPCKLSESGFAVWTWSVVDLV